MILTTDNPGQIMGNFIPKKQNTLSSSLYEFAQLMEDIENNDGVITDEMLPALSQAELTVAQKVDNYVNFSYCVKGQQEQIKLTIEKFSKQLKTLENLYARLRTNVKEQMEAHGMTKIDGHDRSIKLVTSGGVQSTQKPMEMFNMLEVVNPKYVLELFDYLEEKLVYVVKNKEEFKQAVADGKFESISLAPRGKYVKFI